jgi:alkylmercury lyase-like protein
LNISKEERENRKAAVLSALQRLRDKLPLQQRTRAHSRKSGLPMQGYFATGRITANLPRLGRTACQENPCSRNWWPWMRWSSNEYGIGCYPFSARGTGISVHYSDKTVHAMCAVDALAIPRLTQHASRITARCALCGYPLECAIEANGSLMRGDEEGIRVIVIWRPSARDTSACCDSLCPGVKFLGLWELPWDTTTSGVFINVRRLHNLSGPTRSAETGCPDF